MAELTGWGLRSARKILCLTTFAFAVAVAKAAPLPVGSARIECPNGAEPLTLFTYKPPTYREGPLLIVCHGVGRNAEDYRNFAITLAERFKLLVVAPLFDKERFPTWRYQRGGLVDAEGRVRPAADWTYAAIPRIVERVRELEARPQLPYYLIGHSAGGQFLVRLAAFLPGEATRIVAANPGSHLFPVRDQDFGYGFGGLPGELSSDDVIRRFLAAPLTFYLGTGDVRPEPSFDDSPAAMRQGAHRLERGRNCFAAAEALAREKGWKFGWRKVETPGIGHEAAFMFAASEVEDALFGPKG
ncbi:MAG: alpha/beta fold hydrolase [Verrucomicrobia bacterium]|nr:alpha/beta fold hydrolase [Verrucomicrobiota bacterium]